MVEAKVIYTFRDKDDFSKEYKVGDLLVLSEERFSLLVGLGLVTAVDKVEGCDCGEETTTTTTTETTTESTSVVTTKTSGNDKRKK